VLGGPEKHKDQEEAHPAAQRSIEECGIEALSSTIINSEVKQEVCHGLSLGRLNKLAEKCSPKTKTTEEKSSRPQKNAADAGNGTRNSAGLQYGLAFIFAQLTTTERELKEKALRIQVTVAEMENSDKKSGDDEQKVDSVVFDDEWESIQRVVNRFCREFRCAGSQQVKLQEVVKQCDLTDLLSRDARKRPVEKISCFENFLVDIPELLEVVRWSASKFQHGRAINARNNALQSKSNGNNRNCEAEFRHAIREPVEDLSSAIFPILFDNLGCVAFRDLEAVRRRELLSVSLPLSRKYARVAISSDSPGRTKIKFPFVFHFPLGSLLFQHIGTLVSSRRKVANKKDDMRMVLDQVHEDLSSGPFCDVLIWWSNLPLSEVDDFCNGFVEDSLSALAQNSDRFPAKVVKLALPFLHRWAPSGFSSDQNRGLVAFKKLVLPHVLMAFQIDDIKVLFSLIISLTSSDRFAVDPQDIKPDDNFVFDLVETLAQRRWNAWTAFGNENRIDNDSWKFEFAKCIMVMNGLKTYRDIDLTGDLWKSRFASLHLVNAVFMFVQDLGIVNVRAVSRTVTDFDRNECTLRAVFTRDFDEILRHARDYSRCVVQLMRYTLTIDLNVWEIKENQASVNEFALHRLPMGDLARASRSCSVTSTTETIAICC
jgi:hypothetical protein